MKVKINEIKVGDRMRKDLGDVDELASSMGNPRIGQIQPIVIDQDNNLICGGRRLAAAKILQWDDIDVVFREDLDEVSRREIELEENLRRKDFHWVEEVLGVRELLLHRQERYGKSRSGRTQRNILLEVEGRDVEKYPGGYGAEDLAQDIESSSTSISLDLTLANGIMEFPELKQEKTKASAFKRYRLLKETSIRAEQARRTRVQSSASETKSFNEWQAERNGETEPPRPYAPTLGNIVKTIFKDRDSALYNADSRAVLKFFVDRKIKVDCIVTDPPFGLGMHTEGKALSNSRLSENIGGMYEDDPHQIMDMLDEVFGYASQVLKSDGHAYVFFHMTRYEPVYLMLRKHFGDCDETPIIWIKNTPGIGDPNRTWVYAYEPCFHINRGRMLVKPQAFNYLKYDTIPPNQKIHPTEKPAPLLRHLITASCVPGELVLDPFAGSGSTLVAADQVGCKFIGIEKHEPFYRASVERLAERIHEHQEAERTQSPVEANVE